MTEKLTEEQLQAMALDKVRKERADELREMAAKLIAIAEEIEANKKPFLWDDSNL